MRGVFFRKEGFAAREHIDVGSSEMQESARWRKREIVREPSGEEPYGKARCVYCIGILSEGQCIFKNFLADEILHLFTDAE